MAIKKTTTKTKKFWEAGKAYFIRTVTHYHTGKLVREEKDCFIFTNAAWIADTGRFANFLKTGIPNEVEPFPQDLEVAVPKMSIVDACFWPHELPKEQK
jgi:hypothetical protein